MIESPGIPIREIIVDPRVVPRDDMDEDRVVEHIDDLAADLKPKTDLKPIVVFKEGPHRYWIASGFCTLAAYELRERTHIPATILLGGFHEALVYSLRANSEWRVLKRTRRDKRRAVNKALDDPELAKLPGRQIAKLCGVDESTVRDIKAGRLETEAEETEDTDGSDCGNPARDPWDVNHALDQLSQSPAKPVRQMIVLGVPEEEWRPLIEKQIALIREYGGKEAEERMEKLERTIDGIVEKMTKEESAA